MFEKKDKDNNYWSPYIAGALTGAVMILSVWFTGKYVGASTTFVRLTGQIEKIFTPERIEAMEYFKKTSPKIDWQWMFVFGVLIGSFIASLTSKTFKLQAIPPMWEDRFGSNILFRAVVAISGGTVAMFGARLADG